jgi:hypothetical protein
MKASMPSMMRCRPNVKERAGSWAAPYSAPGAVSVIAAGRVIAAGTPDELKSQAGGDRIEVVLREAGDLIPAARVLQARLGTGAHLDHDRRALASRSPTASPP